MRLDTVIKSLPAANAAIKNTASPVAKDGWYPTFSASGQDVWLPEYRFNQKGIVVSAVGARCGKAFKADGKWNICANTHALSVDENIADRDYCWYMLNNEAWWIKGGTAQPFVKVKDSLKREYVFPSLVIQRKIVQELDKITHIIEIRQIELMTLNNLIKARFVEMFGDPEYNNKGLPIKKLSELCNVGSSKRIYQEEQTMDGVPFWRISDLVAKMDTGKVESSLFIPENKYEELKAQGLVPEPDDILVTSRGTLGRCYIVAPDDRFYFQDGMISWLSNYSDEIMPLYIQYLFDMLGFRKQINGLQAGSTVAYLSIAMLKKLDVMLPGRKLQEQFATFVSQVDKSKVVVQKALDEAQLLFDSLMQEYFG